MKKITRNNVWITRDFQEISIYKMETSHIKATLRMMEKNPGWRMEYQQVLKDELALRQTPLMRLLNEEK